MQIVIVKSTHVMSKRFNLIEISDKMVLYRTVETQLKYLKI